MRFLNPMSWFRWFGEFIRAWFVGIPWRDAPKAIPAIILTVVIFITGFVAFSGGSGWRNRMLDRQLAVAIERDDYPTAEIVIRRQLEADPDNADLVYRFALVRNAQSQTEEARALMERLLLRRHVPAAKWLLENDFVGKKWTSLSEDKIDQFGEVLELIYDSEPGNLPVKKMYAEYLIVSERLASAIPLLNELSATEPMRGLQAAELARRIGDREAAEQFASRTLETVSQMAKDDPTNAGLAMAVARNQVFLKRFSEAINTLNRSVKLVKDPKEKRVLSQSLGETIVAWVNFIEESPSNTVAERLRVLKMLQAALRFAPNNPSVITMTADHVLESVNEDNEELASVRAALVKGTSPGIAHFIKGTSALMKGEAEQAELHLKLAVEMLPRSGAIMNNLAVAMVLRENPEYEKALEISNSAIELVKEPTPHFYETRGQILYRLGRFEEAIPDLERALAAEELAKEAHEMLAICYREVGDPELAEMHREAVGGQKESEDEAGEREKKESSGEPADATAR
jgi:tetratricopeptide (TPR) repeat protein